MKIFWSFQALRDVRDIKTAIAKDNLEAAHEMVKRLFSVVETQLSDHPMSGRPGRLANTRELVVHRSYIVVYTLTRHALTILAVRHTARFWPDRL